MSFTYGERLGGRGIRLLKVYQSHDKALLRVELAVRGLGLVEFEALSYVWGSSSNKQEISCNGRPFHVTENLHAALLERRRRGVTSWLWVDALCINQEDTEERTRQVRMMKEIYSKAERVVVWLGQDERDDDQGIELAERIYNACDGASFDIDQVNLTIRADDFDYEDKELPRPFRPCSAIRNPAWICLHAMLDLSWFTRVWVIQELLVARQSVMWRGRFELDPKVILFTAVLVTTKRELWTYYSRWAERVDCAAYNMAKLYFRYKKRGAQPFWDALCECGSMQASDHRDKYFALVGISSGLQHELVDYSKSLGQIYAQVGYLCLRGLPEQGMPSSGLDLLAHGHYRDHMSPTFGKVSWVPGLISEGRSSPTLAEAYPTADLCRTKKDYTAARSGVEFRFLVDVAQSQAVGSGYAIPLGLEVHGSPLGRIETMEIRSDPMLKHEFVSATVRLRTVNDLLQLRAQQSAEMILWLLELREIARQSSDEDFWRTLVYNRDGNLGPAPLSLGRSFACMYLELALKIEEYFTGKTPSSAQDQLTFAKLSTAATPFNDAWDNLANQRSFFRAEDGRIGWVPRTADPGDYLYIFKGMRVPVVMRRLEDSGRWQLVGACYVHGLMDGEAEDMAQGRWERLRIM